MIDLTNRGTPVTADYFVLRVGNDPDAAEELMTAPATLAFAPKWLGGVRSNAVRLCPCNCHGHGTRDSDPRA